MTTDPDIEALEAAREAQRLYDERTKTAAWLGTQTFPDLEWIVEGILPEGMGLIVAPPKAGKSWWVANVALACASGGYALSSIKVKPRPVLYMALEDGHRRMQSRLRKLHGDAPLPEALSIIIKADQHEALTLLDEFLRRHRDEAPLAIIDTLGKVKPSKRANEDAYQADYRIGSALKGRIDEVPGGCLLLVHHTRKAESGDFIDSVSGTQGIAGSADYTLILSRKRKATDAVLAVTGRDVAENEYALTINDGAWSLDGMDLMDSAAIVETRRESAGKSDRTMAVLALVQRRPETRAADVATELSMTADDAGKYLRRLEKDGLIRKAGRGLFKPLSEVSEVSEPEDTTGNRRLHVLPQTDTSDTTDTLPTGTER